MAKRTPRQELRTTPTRAPYRREKATAAPAAMDLPMPVPIAVPIAAAAPAPMVMPAPVPTVVSAQAPIAIEAPTPSPAPVAIAVAALPSIVIAAPLNLPDLLAVAQSALGFAAAALDPLPAPSQLVHGDPSAAEPPPGRAPAGDARSLRTPEQFALIYRHGASVVSRRGKLGERGAWRVVDYPGPAPAAHAYALECSRLIEQGFRDVE